MKCLFDDIIISSIRILKKLKDIAYPIDNSLPPAVLTMLHVMTKAWESQLLVTALIISKSYLSKFVDPIIGKTLALINISQYHTKC